MEKRRGVHVITGILIKFESFYLEKIELIEKLSDNDQKKIMV